MIELGGVQLKVMFICTGNTCRSAMAEAILKKKAQVWNKNIDVFSSGLYAQNGDGPTSAAIEVMEEMGYDMSGHYARNIRNSNILDMDVILCATNSQKVQTIMMYPELKEKIYTIKEYAFGENGDISDPWGHNKNTYEICAKELEKCIDKMENKL